MPPKVPGCVWLLLHVLCLFHKNDVAAFSLGRRQSYSRTTTTINNNNQNDATTTRSTTTSTSALLLLLRAALDTNQKDDHNEATTTAKNSDTPWLLTRRNAIVRPTAALTAAIAASSNNPVSNHQLPGFQPACAATTTLPNQQSSSVQLSDGTTVPLVSFGLQIYDDARAYQLTLTALECGYRNFFASVLAGNQRGFARAVRDSGVPRSDLYICGSVVSNRASGYDQAFASTKRGCLANMEAFGAGNIDYLDQIMLDYPGPDCDSIRGQWAAFETMQRDEKLVTSLSVSNFSPSQLDCILLDPQSRGSKPVINQLPYSVAYHPPSATYAIDENQKRNVLVQAWAPLGGSLGGRFTASLKQKCAQIGQAYGKSWAQVALRWIVQHGASFTTQTQKRSHFVENLDIFDFVLTAEEMATLDQLA